MVFKLGKKAEDLRKIRERLEETERPMVEKVKRS